jgi:hypothetical protein
MLICSTTSPGSQSPFFGTHRVDSCCKSAGEASSIVPYQAGCIINKRESRVDLDFSATVAQHRLAAAQGYDAEHYWSGSIYRMGHGVHNPMLKRVGMSAGIMISDSM